MNTAKQIKSNIQYLLTKVEDVKALEAADKVHWGEASLEELLAAIK